MTRTIEGARAWLKEQLKSQGYPDDVYERGGGLQLELSDDGSEIAIWLADCTAGYDVDPPMRHSEFNEAIEAWIFLFGSAAFNRLPDALVREEGVELVMPTPSERPA